MYKVRGNWKWGPAHSGKVRVSFSFHVAVVFNRNYHLKTVYVFGWETAHGLLIEDVKRNTFQLIQVFSQSLFSFPLCVFFYWSFKPLLPESILFQVHVFPSCSPKTGRFLCACLEDLAHLLPYLCPSPWPKLKRCLYHGDTMAHGLLSLVNNIFAKWAGGPSLYVWRNLHSWRPLLLMMLFCLTLEAIVVFMPVRYTYNSIL